MAPKPPQLPDFANGPDAAIVEPLPEEKLKGFEPGEAPLAEHLNWLFRMNWSWLGYLDTLEEHDFTWSGTNTFTGPVGFQGDVTVESSANFGPPQNFKEGIALTDENSPNLLNLRALITAERSAPPPEVPGDLQPLPLFRSGLVGLYHGIGNEGTDTLPGLIIAFNAQVTGMDGQLKPVWHGIDTFQPAYRISVLKSGLVMHRAENTESVLNWVRVGLLPAAGPPAFLRQDFGWTGSNTVNVTNHATHGYVTIPAGQNTIIVNHPDVTVDTSIFLQIEGGTFDATLTRVQPWPGSQNFQVRGNANATANVRVRWLLVVAP